MRTLLGSLIAGVALTAWGQALGQQAGELPAFRFRSLLQDPPSLTVAEPVIVAGEVVLGGGDSRRPTRPFLVDWGDGHQEEGFFPFRHGYDDRERDYGVTVTARYEGGEGRARVRVRFTPVSYGFSRDPDVARRVRVPAQAPELASTMPGYGPPSGLVGFAEADLGVPRPAWEYLLDVGCHLQLDFCNGDVAAGADEQIVILGAPGFGGAFSLWFTQPVAVAAGPGYLASLAGVSSLYHELGHDLTLNTPARFRLGGRTDGPMSTIVSETLAQVFQHATAWEVLNRPGRFGLGEELCEGLRRSALDAFAFTSQAYHQYVGQGCRFATRQREGDTEDRTLGTFMALAWVFVERAEERGGFREPLRRTMALLQTFREEDRVRYQAPANDAFRATLMVAAFSHGLGEDLRPRFGELRFELDDGVYAELLARVAER